MSRPASAGRASRPVAVVALAVWLTSTAAAAQPGSVLDPATAGDDAARAPLSTGRLVARAIGLSPCEPEAAIAFSSDRSSDGIWAGRFLVHRPGSGGDWHLVVFDENGVEQFRHRLSAGDSADIQTGLIPSTRVRIQLLGPAVPGSVCPRVRLESELQRFSVSRPRGQVGDKDERLLESSPLLAALPDADGIRRWSGGVAHIDAKTPGGLFIPCSGFFVGPRVLVTAAHCIRSSLETPDSIVVHGNRRLTKGALKHLVSAIDAEHDFTIIWVTTEDAATTLPVRDAVNRDLILWQFPGQPGPRVSVEQCAVFNADANLLSHKCDTEVGSSGAPIQARPGGEVVALHVLGCRESNATANCVNHGIPLAKIRARLRALEPALRQKHPIEAPQVLAAFGLAPP